MYSGNYDVIVTNPSGGLNLKDTKSNGFNYIEYPYITKITDAGGTTDVNSGSAWGGLRIKVWGYHFSDTLSNKTEIRIGGSLCTNPVIVNNTGTNIADADHVTCDTPLNSPGVKDVVVTNPTGNLSSTLDGAFTYIAPDANIIYAWRSTNRTNGRITHGTDVGIDAAHKICADDASVVFGSTRTHKAYLYTSSNDPSTYVTGADANKAVHRLTHVVISNKWSHFVSPSIGNTTGVDLVNKIVDNKEFWSGTQKFINNPQAYRPRFHCNGWTTDAGGFSFTTIANAFRFK